MSLDTGVFTRTVLDPADRFGTLRERCSGPLVAHSALAFAHQGEESIMGIVISLLVIAVGAIMRFAVTVKGHGFNVHTTGVILIIVGIIGAVLSIVYWASWGGFSHNASRNGLSRRTTVVSTQAPVGTVVHTDQPVVSHEHPATGQPDIL
jgi:hypothetical protein